MQIEQLEYLIEIGKHKSLNSASKALHMTPQALSMAIKRLENELGVPIAIPFCGGDIADTRGTGSGHGCLEFSGAIEGN